MIGDFSTAIPLQLLCAIPIVSRSISIVLSWLSLQSISMARIIQWEETAMVGSNRAFMIVCLGLGAWALSVAGAFAQAPAAAPQSDSRPGSPAAATLTGVWDTIEWVERRYKIEAMRFKARDETGVDWWGSDEVMVATHDIKGGTVTDEIGDIDSGDTHHFDPAKSCIIAVRPGSSCSVKHRCAMRSASPRHCFLRSSSGSRTSTYPTQVFSIALRAMITITVLTARGTTTTTTS
jgi:hypothetical protein